VLLIGAGGARPACSGRCSRPRRRARRRQPHARQGASLVERHARWRRARRGAAARALDDAGDGYDVVVNASASSLAARRCRCRACCAPGALALDMMYGPARTASSTGPSARRVGRDGLGMLVEQAAEAFCVWRGVRPDTAPVLAALRAAAGRRMKQRWRVAAACWRCVLRVVALALQLYFLARSR
jgi:shikimate dehydrogenase